MHLAVISTIVDLKPTIDFTANLIGTAVVTIVVPWVAAKFLQKLHVDKQSALGQRIITAAENAASMVIAKTTDLADAHSKIDVKNAMAAAGAVYVQTAVPEALAALGTSPEHLKDLVLAKIQQQLPAQINAQPPPLLMAGVSTLKGA